tara:strand:- start:2394 stop:3101 length:708 start_codon:yes stop_codon:yes gene_type:complete
MINDKPIVILASDENPYYSDFSDIVIRAWEKMGFEVDYTIISDKNKYVPDSVIPYGNQAQICRVLSPYRYPNRICMTSDIDMMPLNKEYFVEALKAIKNKDDFTSLSSDAHLGNAFFTRHPICYLAGHGSTFSKITGVIDITSMEKKMLDWWNKGHGWNTDEMCFSADLGEAIDEEGITLHSQLRGWQHGLARRRLDRSNWVFSHEKLISDEYIDAHMPRPYSKYKNHIDQLIRD